MKFIIFLFEIKLFYREIEYTLVIF